MEWLHTDVSQFAQATWSATFCFFLLRYCTNKANQATTDIPITEKRKKETENLRIKTEKYDSQIEDFEVLKYMC